MNELDSYYFGTKFEFQIQKQTWVSCTRGLGSIRLLEFLLALGRFEFFGVAIVDCWFHRSVNGK